MTSYETKRKNVRKWISSYIEKVFADAGRYGHLFERHINQDASRICERCAREHENISSFYGKADEVINLLYVTLMESADEIADWLADDTDDQDWVIYGDFRNDHVKGKIFLYSGNHNWDDGPLECSEFSIVLAKLHHANGFKIRSCYPVY